MESQLKTKYDTLRKNIKKDKDSVFNWEIENKGGEINFNLWKKKITLFTEKLNKIFQS